MLRRFLQMSAAPSRRMTWIDFTPGLFCALCHLADATQMAVPPVTRLPPVKQVPVTTHITGTAAARKPSPPPAKPKGNQAPARRRPKPPPGTSLFCHFKSDFTPNYPNTWISLKDAVRKPNGGPSVMRSLFSILRSKGLP